LPRLFYDGRRALVAPGHATPTAYELAPLIDFGETDRDANGPQIIGAPVSVSTSLDRASQPFCFDPLERFLDQTQRCVIDIQRPVEILLPRKQTDFPNDRQDLPI
jgi:hypothetical protein